MITSERDSFIGAHVTDAVKASIEKESALQGKSMSLFIYETLKEKLHLLGYDVGLPEFKVMEKSNE